MKALSSLISYFLKRALPFVCVYFAIQVFLRIAFSIWEKADLAISAPEVFKFIFAAIWLDFAALIFILIPLTLYLVFLPTRLHGSKFDRVATFLLLLTYTFVLLFDAVAEWLFWDEFHVRFNFIAVDYLVYTNEVFANIWQSYPIVWLLLLVAIIAALIAWIVFNYFILKTKFATIKFARRIQFLALYCLFAIAIFFASNNNQSEVAVNEHINEITKNGIFSLFSAFRNNSLDFEKFYLTSYKGAALPSLQSLVKFDQSSTEFKNNNPNDLTRFILAAGTQKNLNVIVVMLESHGAEYLAHFGAKEDLNPNFNRLAAESLFFSNTYATGTRTVRGMEALTLSIPPSPGRSIVKRQNNENLASIGFVFQDRGYNTEFIYGGYGYFDNMNYFYSNNGFKSVDRSDFSSDEQSFTNAWGVSDEDLYKKVIKEADKSFATKDKFMFMVMTTSNHRPFTFPENDVGIPTEGGGREAGVRYADYAVGKFISEAKLKPWFNDTVFVFVADHTAGSAGRAELTAEMYHIPMMIYSPHNIKPLEYTKLASQIDLAPTLLGILNFSYNSRFYGVDLLRNNLTPRAFIGNYQKLGLLSNDILTVLNAQKGFNQYKDNDLQQEVNEPLLLETITYYRNASNWFEQSARINTLKP